MGLAILDENFIIIGNPQILVLPRNLWQDTPLVVLNEALYLVSMVERGEHSLLKHILMA